MFVNSPQVSHKFAIKREGPLVNGRSVTPKHRYMPLLHQVHTCSEANSIVCATETRRMSILSSSGLLRGVRWFETDVSGLPIGSIFKIQDIFLEQLYPWRWDFLKPRDNPEDGRIEFNRGGSLGSRKRISPKAKQLHSALHIPTFKALCYSSKEQL